MGRLCSLDRSACTGRNCYLSAAVPCVLGAALGACLHGKCKHVNLSLRFGSASDASSPMDWTCMAVKCHAGVLHLPHCLCYGVLCWCTFLPWSLLPGLVLLWSLSPGLVTLHFVVPTTWQAHGLSLLWHGYTPLPFGAACWPISCFLVKCKFFSFSVPSRHLT